MKLSNRCLVPMFITGLIASFLMLWYGDKKGSDDHNSFEQARSLDCQQLKSSEKIYMTALLGRLGRGENADYERGRTLSYMDSAFTMCFPPDPKNPDKTPHSLLLKIDDRTTVPQFETLQKGFDEGWELSKVGEPWRGATDW